MAKLSVILCVYNTSPELLNEALDSIYGSTLKDLEVILVDDGSTVNYDDILNKYVKIKYEKTENRGTLSARLTGIELATSDFVTFVDSDDLVSFDYFEAMLSWQKKTGTDIVINDWAFYTKNAKYIIKKDSTISKNFIVKDDLVLRRFFMSKGREQSYHVLWNKIYDRKILLKCVEEIRKLNIERLVYAEDLLISFFAFRYAKSVSNVHVGYYFYRLHNLSECAGNSTEKIENHIISDAMVLDVMQNDLQRDDSFVYVQDNFDYWKNMTYKSYQKTIKRMNQKNLLSTLENAFNIKKAAKGIPAQNYIYSHQKLLPDNLQAIDDDLKKIYYSNKYLKIYAKRGSYAYKTLASFKLVFGKRINIVRKKKFADFVITNEKFKLKNRILHNHLVYKIGMMLFPKGSSFRKKIKAKI